MQEKYEISLWEDVWHPSIPGYSEGGRTVPEVPGWFEERKLCVIGSDKITATCRALEPKLVRNIDGTNTLTFKMLYVCRDDTYEELLRQFIVEPNNEQSLDLNNLYGRVDLIPLLARADHFGHETYKNPFIKLLTNERKVKAFWQGKWYDLLIKNCQESSDQRMVTYTCTDIFINELSKSGTDIILDTELKNNNGSVEELAEVVLDGTDWFVDSEKCDLIQQFKEEAVYEVTTLQQITANNDTLGSVATTISNGSNILVSYSQIQDAIYKFCERVEIDPYLQFAYTTDPSYECADGGMVVTNADIYSCDNVTYKFYRSNNVLIPKGNMSILDEIGIVKAYIANAANPFISITLINNGYITVSDNYRINRLVRAQKTVYDPVIKKYCTVYEGIGNFSTFINVGDEIHKYVESQYNNPVNVNNLIVNGKGFTSLDGWSGNNLSFKLYPEYNSHSLDPYTPKSYLKFISNQNVYNAGLRYNSNYISNGFAEGEQYILRYKAMTSDNQGNISGTYYIIDDNCITPKIVNYTYDNQNTIIIDPNEDPNGYFNVEEIKSLNGWIYFRLKCIKSATRADIYNDRIGLFLEIGNAINDVLWLEEMQLFAYIADGQDNFLCPGEMSTDLVVTTTYNYYNYTKNKDALNEEDIVYLWRGTTENPTLATYIAPVYNENFEKILTVSAKQSNRYNLLRTLAEKFECYVYFNIEHNPLTGALIYENNIPKKSVYFKNTQGQRTGIGFIYGIDLKAVQRTIQSDQIVTKTVVSMNNNQYAKDGFCTIARSKENYTKESFILNFDYYVSQNLLNKEDLDRELKRYYSMLNFYNSNYNDEVNHINQLSAILLKQRSYLILYESTINNLILQKENLWNELTSLTGGVVVDDGTYHTYIQNHPDATEVISRYQAIKSLEDSLSSYQDSYSNLESSVSGLESQIENLKAGAQVTLTALVNEHAVFYRKYSRFIQEGTWKDDNYMDDDLYYLDALKVARESAHPKVSYNISVIRVSSLEEFKAKQFQLGDITYIQDTEFFGYTTINGIKTPYKESVLISEITSNFEEPEKDSFKVQNYKTEFEDLFQRINRTSQTYGYAADRYEKIDAISTTDGLLDAEVLQDSINAAKVPISISGNRITQDENGIIISDLTQANRQTRITAGGISVTTDGGDTWKNTMVADGVPIEGLAPGVIDVGKVGLVDRSNNLQWTSQGIKDQNNFISWDSQGISIYGATPSSTLDSTKYIRFSKGGMEMRGSTGSEGVTYDNSGNVHGDFNNIYVAITDASDSSITNRIEIDNDSISHYDCDGNLCSPGGEIRFNTPDGIVMRPRNGSEINITLSTTQIDLNANIVNINGARGSNPASLTFDIGQAKMIYTYISGGETIKKQLDFLDLRSV